MLWKTVFATALCAAAYSQPSLAQGAPPVILNVDIENVVQYVDDTTDFTKLATVPGATVGGAPLNFRRFIILADIVAVNGTPAKGTLVESARAITMRPSPTPGQAIADVTRNNQSEFAFEILTVDGNQIGTVVGTAIGNGPAPPGAPQLITQGNNPITGGTGAFMGARGLMGQFTTAALTSTQRVASMAEDPANRRINGGAKQKYILYIIPMTRPGIVLTAAGPAIVHSSDFSLVTASKPAAPGEVLSMVVTGLGPTRPGVDPGQPFPSAPLATVNSPVEVTVNGKAAAVLGAAGYPGSVDTYQVNFRVPSDAASGPAAVSVSAAWIAGPAANISVQ
jgi:hypothetical protein